MEDIREAKKSKIEASSTALAVESNIHPIFSDSQYADKIDSSTITHHVILVNTDPGNDVDDDVACGWLLKALLMQKSTTTFHLIFVVQTYDKYCPLTKKTGRKRLEDALISFNDEEVVTQLLVAKNTIDTNDTNNSSINSRRATATGQNLVEILPPQLLPLSYKVTLLLNIAPNLDDIVRSENLIELQAVSHQGGYSKLNRNANAFNEKNSCQTLEYIFNCGNSNNNISNSNVSGNGIHYIITEAAECLAHYRFSQNLFQLYEVPQYLRNLCRKEAFKMIVGRMSPSLGVVSAKFAQGLIVPGHNGKPGMNYVLIKELEAAVLSENGNGDGNDESLLVPLTDEEETNLQEAVNRYMHLLEETIIEYNDANTTVEGFSAEVMNSSTSKNLLECEHILLQCRIPVIKFHNINTASTAASNATLMCGNDADFDFLDDCSHPMGRAFHAIATLLPLSPAYDLIAAVRLLNYTGHTSWDVRTPEVLITT